MFCTNFARTAMTSAFALLAVALASGSASAQAFSVVPMTQEFTASDRAAADAFVVENNTDQPMLLSVKVMTRESGSDGQEINNDTPDFGISPRQSVIGPKQKQTVRLQWQGAPSPNAELAYRVIIDQEPIKSSPNPESHAVKLALHVVAPIYVVPAR